MGDFRDVSTLLTFKLGKGSLEDFFSQRDSVFLNRRLLISDYVSVSLFLTWCKIFGGVQTENTLTYRGEAAALIVLALPCSRYPLMNESTYPASVLSNESQ